MITQVDQSHKSINQNNELNQSQLNSSNNIDSFLLEQAEAEKQKAIEKERIDKEIKEDLKKIKVNFSNLYKVNRSRSLEQQKQESQLRINQIFITKNMVQNQNYPISPNFKKEIEELFDLNIIKPFESPALKEKFYEILTQDKIIDFQNNLFWLVFMKNFPQQIKDNSETNSIKVTDHRKSLQDDKNKRNPWYNQSFIFMQQGRGHKIIDRNTYQKIKRNKKVELEQIQEKFVNQQGDEYYNIAPSLRVKASGRDISYQRLRFNLNGISPTIKGELGLRERSLPDTLQKIIFHPIDRVIKMNNYNQIVENSKQKLLKQIYEIEEKSYEDLNPLIQGNFNQKNENEKQEDSNQKKQEQVGQQPGQQYQKNKKNSKSSEIFKNKIQKKTQQPKSILAQYDLSHGQFGKNEISKNPMIYKDMLEMKMVLNVYSPKEMQFKLIKQRTALSKKGAGWNIYQHLIDFND
ncbi:hypothetical protein PPERSA_09600 [Pseudocohnilembus persalinus]|uniref:Uncharacterized protein n=1 Tax=Pseudocohnilembus persalinus TaxID=266149 RepID=A0A0V0QFL1_PSEPJ|nr:hypothetical protein PPERSA_09600 [Pseudocohnilembus persalinus]|eukprot:KRX00994.1 hypothetical protein PPERSA_09600 [Pseudocohnilembus persalinus]